MLSTSRLSQGYRRPWPILAVLMLAWCGLAHHVAAQEPPRGVPGTLQPPLPGVPEKGPRPAKGPGSIAEFVELSKNDAIFAVIVGQSRIFTTKMDLIVAEKPAPVIAVGDPSVVEVNIVDKLKGRQIRLVGQRIGVTDLSIIANDQVYTFDVHVMADLDLLRRQIQGSFPDATVKLSQLRDHVVVEGEVKDTRQREKVVDMISAYLSSVRVSEMKTIKEKPGPGDTKPEIRAAVDHPQVIDLLQVRPQPGRDPVVSSFVSDLKKLEEGIRSKFPDSRVRLTQVQDHDIVAEGQARDTRQVGLIIEMVEAYQESYRLRYIREIALQAKQVTADKGGLDATQFFRQVLSTLPKTKVINLIRVPGARQVLLKVRIAELNRTALRQVGTEWLAAVPEHKALFGSKVGGSSAGSSVTAGSAGLTGVASLLAGGPATMFGVFENSHFALFFNALRKNDLLKILAEPNLVALDGHKSNFLAGGEFPVPVPQNAGAGGAATITIEFKKFGVSLDFLPNILDGGMVRLAVDPEVSSIDFSIGTSINGTVVPGLNIRRSHTVVEMKEGQTLAIAGLMQVQLEGNTNRIPGLGDVPVLGPFFSNTSSKRLEKELIVLVTPYLVEAMPCEQVGPNPGDEVNAPNDLELYLGNRIEGKTGRDWRATTQRYTVLPTQLPTFLRLQDQYIRGPHGFSD